LAAAGSITAAILISRILGVFRESLRAALLGAGFYADSYVIGFRIPNLLRDLFAEGALSAAFVPTFSDSLVNRSREDAYRLGNLVLTLVFLITGALVALGICFSSELVGAIAPGFAREPAKAAFAARLTLIMMPFLTLVALAAVLMGMLNAQRHFFVPALAPALFNLASIAVALGLYFTTKDPRTAALGWSAGVLLGGLAQLFCQVPSLWRLGYRPRVALQGALSDPGLRRMAHLMLPAVLGLGAVQINIFVNSIYASQLGDGPVSWLDYAFRLYYLPIGLFGVALGTVTQSTVSEDAARGDLSGLRRNLSHSLRLVFFLTLPAMAGLLALSRPVVDLLYQHGRFTPDDAQATALVLCCYVLGLPAIAMEKVIEPTFYALNSPRVPLIGSLLAVGTNFAFNAIFWDKLGAPGIALGAALGAYLNTGFQFALIRSRLGGFEGEDLIRAFGKILVAAMLVGLLAYWSAELTGWLWPEGQGSRLLRMAARALVPVALAVAVYLPYCERVGIAETAEVRDALSRLGARIKRLGGRGARAGEG